jgi:hypothetical protein
MASMATISTNKEFSIYYSRKVREGKKQMLVLNTIRNKIIHRLFAVIKRGTSYQLEYQLA